MNTQGDWVAVAIVCLIGLALLVYGLVDERLAPRRRAAANRRAIASVTEPVPFTLTDLGGGVLDEATETWVVDHVQCVNDDCDVVLCYCSSWEPCEGAQEPGCTHPGAMVCGEHRLSECTDCLDDARSDAGVL